MAGQLHKTRGIVLRVTSYAESSAVVQVFTEQFGLQSYLVNGVKKPKARIPLTILQPLHLLEMVVFHKPQGGLQRISEARQIPLFRTIPYDVMKSSVVLFLNEMLYKCLRQQSADEPLFAFVFNALVWLDETADMPANFHLYFLMRLTRFLGFCPAAPGPGHAYFDLKDGVFCRQAPGHSLVLMEPQTSQWALVLRCRLDDLSGLTISRADRQFLTAKMIDFYRLHIDHIGELKSHQVLEEVLG